MALFALLSGGSVIDLDGTFLIQLGIFLAALLLLNTLVFRPLMALFDARHAGIEGAREQARVLTEEAQSKAAAYDDQLRKVKLAAGVERDRLRAEGLHLERTVLEKVRKESRLTLENAEAQIAKEASQARREIDAQIPAIAGKIVEKVLGRELRT